MVKPIGRHNKNEEPIKKNKNVINLFSYDSIDKSNILNLNDYKNAIQVKKSNHGSNEDFDESSYVNPEDYDYWDN